MFFNFLYSSTTCMDDFCICFDNQAKVGNSGIQYYRINTESSQHQETESRVSENSKVQEHKKSIWLTASKTVGIKVIKQSKSQKKEKELL